MEFRRVLFRSRVPSALAPWLGVDDSLAGTRLRTAWPARLQNRSGQSGEGTRRIDSRWKKADGTGASPEGSLGAHRDLGRFCPSGAEGRPSLSPRATRETGRPELLGLLVHP